MSDDESQKETQIHLRDNSSSINSEIKTLKLKENKMNDSTSSTKKMEKTIMKMKKKKIKKKKIPQMKKKEKKRVRKKERKKVKKEKEQLNLHLKLKKKKIKNQKKVKQKKKNKKKENIGDNQQNIQQEQLHLIEQELFVEQ